MSTVLQLLYYIEHSNADISKINYLKEPVPNIAGESKFELIDPNDDSCIKYTICNEKNHYLDGKTAKNIKLVNVNHVRRRALDIQGVPEVTDPFNFLIMQILGALGC